MLTVCYILNYLSFIESLRNDFFALTLRLEVQCHKAGLEVTPASYFIFCMFLILLYIYVEPNKAKGHNYSPLSKWPPLK